jgi:hypothetical protein
MRPVTKEVFLNSQLCATKGWYLRQREQAPAPTEGELFRMEQGIEVERQARSLFPNGIFVPAAAPAEAASKTKQLMEAASVLFEATFFIDGYIAKPDILKRSSTGWDVMEVKSSLEDTQQLDDFVDDLAYTVMVVQRCGITVSCAALVLISRGYRKGMGANRLLTVVDQTVAVMERVRAFLPVWQNVAEETAEATRPQPTLNSECKRCDFFPSQCLGKGVASPAIYLPNLHKTKIAQLGALGCHEIEHLPHDFPLTDAQSRVVICVRTKQPYVARTLSEELSKMQWPAHYLDFETVMTALPLYDGSPPYEQLCTQYSIHHCSAPGNVIGHSEYLSEPERDCQREVAERLLTDVGTDGSIIVYSHFEEVRVSALAERFADLAPALTKLKDRIFDLLPVIRRCFYHHGFGGSYSIKAALPALATEMSYEGLGIGDGDTAVARFAKMALAMYSPEEAKKVRKELLEYCEQDTLAMVRLHEKLLAHC